MIRLVIITAAAFLFLLTACAPTLEVKPLDAAESSAIAGGEKAIVLFRYSVSRDAKSYDPASERRFTYANIDKGQLPPDVAAMRSPSPEALAQGWHYAILEPGSYYFLVYPPGMQQNPPALAYHLDTGRYGRLANKRLHVRRDAFWSAGLQRYLIKGPQPPDFEAVSGFHIYVGAGEAVVYAGSLTLDCGTIPGVFGRLTDDCAAFQVIDESTEAINVAADAFGDSGTVTTRLMSRYGEPGIALGRAGLQPMAIHAGATGEQPSAAFTGRAAAPTFLLPGGSIPGGTGQAIGVFNVVVLLAQLAEASAQDDEAKKRAEAAAPCLKGLAEQILLKDATSGLESALRQSLRDRDLEGILSDTPVSGSSVRSRAEVTLLGAGLRECAERATFCVEVSAQIRVVDMGTGAPLYHAIMVYSNDYRSDPLQAPYRLYQVRVPPDSPCRDLGSYCSEGGAELVRREINAGIEAISDRLAGDLAVAVGNGTNKGS